MKKKRMNKRGFLLGEETVKIIIAVLAIGVLVYLLFSIYLNSVKNEKLEQAEASLEKVIRDVNNQESETIIYNPKDWWAASWPISGVLPEKCSNIGWENCVCICPEQDTGTLASWGVGKISSLAAKNFASFCDDGGACMYAGEDVYFEPSVFTEVPKEFEINYEDERTIIKEK